MEKISSDSQPLFAPCCARGHPRATTAHPKALKNNRESFTRLLEPRR